MIQKKGNDIVHFFLPICSVFGRLFKSFSICLESVESLQDFTLFPETWASSRMRPSEIVNSVEESGKDVIPMAISPKVKIETKVKNSVTCIVTLSVCPLVRLSVCLSVCFFFYSLSFLGTNKCKRINKTNLVLIRRRRQEISLKTQWSLYVYCRPSWHWNTSVNLIYSLGVIHVNVVSCRIHVDVRKGLF